MQLTRPKKQRKEGSFVTLCERFTNPLAENVGFEPRLSIPNATCYHYTTFSISGGALLWQLPHLPRCLCPVTDDTGYLYSLTRGVPTATPFHGCTSTVAHLSRPIGVFATFATVTSPTPFYIVLHLMAWLGLGGVEPPGDAIHVRG